MKKVLTVIGTRPEAIKMCPLVLELERREGIESAVCVTGQHREVLWSVLEEFGVKSRFALDAMGAGAELSSLCAYLICEIDRILGEYRPDIVLVHGDTLSAFAASLAAFYRRVRIAHVEAGLRTGDIKTPFPEELDRRTISLMSDIDFAPTAYAAKRLLSEGKREERIFVTGNTVIDSFGYTLKKDFSHPLLDFAKGSRLILFTCHRRENIGEPMRRIFRAVKRVCEKREDIRFVYPVHMNPKVREIAYSELSHCERVKLCEPLSLCDMHNILARSYLALTDSGGIQEEASYLGVPVIVLRESTERQEGVESGGIVLAGTYEDGIERSLLKLIDDSSTYRKMASAPSPFGKGDASQRIADVLCAELGRMNFGDKIW